MIAIMADGALRCGERCLEQGLGSLELAEQLARRQARTGARGVYVLVTDGLGSICELTPADGGGLDIRWGALSQVSPEGHSCT